MLRYIIIILLSLLVVEIVAQDFVFNNYQKSTVRIDALDERFTDYEIVDFQFDYDELKKKDGQVIASQFFFDALVDIDLYPSYLLKSEYKESLSAKSQSVPMTYFGYDQSTTASMTFNNGFIYGFVRHRDIGEYYIEPVSFYAKSSPNQYVIYNSSHVISQDVKCGLNETASRQEDLKERTLKATSCEIIEMAIASDFTMYERYGSIAAVENHNTAVMNCVNTNFIDEFDINVVFEIATQFVSTSDSMDPVSNTTNISAVLTEFTNWTDGSPWFDGFDMYQFWTAREIGGGAVGLAFLPGSHHVLEDFGSGASLQSLTAHEIGHNFSANHVNSQTIMFGSVVITNDWDATSVNEIDNRLTAIAPWLENCVLDDAPIARINASSISLCGESVINIVDKSLYGTSRTWSVSGGQISSTTAESITFEATTSGVYTITLTSTNSIGTDVDTIDIEVQSDNPPHCTPTNNMFGDGGLASWSIIEGSDVVFSNNSSLATETGNYENFYCSSTVSLESNTTYTIAFTSVPCDQNLFQFFRIFIDYNNDGDFTDSGENVVSSNFLWCGGPITQGANGGQETGLIFTTPSSPMMDTGLRLRVLVDNSSQSAASTNTCYSPSTGQIEDYLLVFGSIATCSDGIQNQGELAIDCGGPCAPCVTGCDTDVDAYNYVSSADIDETCETCFDGIQNGDEGGIDCDGSYPGCPPCFTCTDGIQNQGEQAIDCGGPCAPCVTGCDTDTNAYNYVSSADIDEPCETCFDGVQNGDEASVDCGGTYPGCQACPCLEVFASNFNQPGPCVYDCNESTATINSNDPDTLITSSNVLSTSGTINLNASSPTYWRAENMVEININTTVNSELTIDVGPCND